MVLFSGRNVCVCPAFFCECTSTLGNGKQVIYICALWRDIYNLIKDLFLFVALRSWGNGIMKPIGNEIELAGMWQVFLFFSHSLGVCERARKRARSEMTDFNHVTHN